MPTSGKKKPIVQVRDMTSRKDPKGGAGADPHKGESFHHKHKKGHKKEDENKLGG